MTEAEIEIILQAPKEENPKERPRIISDNGPQFNAKDFKEFVQISAGDRRREGPEVGGGVKAGGRNVEKRADEARESRQNIAQLSTADG